MASGEVIRLVQRLEDDAHYLLLCLGTVRCRIDCNRATVANGTPKATSALATPTKRGYAENSGPAVSLAGLSAIDLCTTTRCAKPNS